MVAMPLEVGTVSTLRRVLAFHMLLSRNALRSRDSFNSKDQGKINDLWFICKVAMPLEVGTVSTELLGTERR